MNIIVLIKEVPDMDKVKFDSERGVVNRSSAEGEINPFDLNALQAAVNLKHNYGGNIIVLTMGPPKAEKSLRDAYARGGDEVVLLTDRKFGGSDTWATSKALAAGVQKIGDYDLIICGEKSVDGDTAQVGAEVAEFLNIPHSYYVEDIMDLNSDSINIQVESIGESKQIRKMELPALISVTKNMNDPELPSLDRKLQSLNINIIKLDFMSVKDFISEEEVGFKGSPTKVSKIKVPKAEKRDSTIYKNDSNSFINDMMTRLKDRNVI